MDKTNKQQTVHESVRCPGLEQQVLPNVDAQPRFEITLLTMNLREVQLCEFQAGGSIFELSAGDTRFRRKIRVRSEAVGPSC
jgi:hypothetical protein